MSAAGSQWPPRCGHSISHTWPATGQVTQPQTFELIRIAQSIQIGMHDRHGAQGIGFDQRVGGAAHHARMPEGLQKAARQRGFAGAQIAVQQHLQRLRDVRPAAPAPGARRWPRSASGVAAIRD